jgi:hypothetical protein
LGDTAPEEHVKPPRKIPDPMRQFAQRAHFHNFEKANVMLDSFPTQLNFNVSKSTQGPGSSIFGFSVTSYARTIKFKLLKPSLRPFHCKFSL